MVGLVLNLKGDGILEGFPSDKIVQVKDPITVTTLEGGMTSGLPSIGIIIDLPDGRKVFAETSVRLFLTAARAIEARYGDLLTVNKG